MQTNQTTICAGCLQKINGERICPYCGNDTTIDNLPLYLRTFTLLQNKYVIGKVLHFNGEYAIYIGYDVVQKHKVLVKEYVPSVLCKREPDGTIAVQTGYEAQYKSLMADFYDLNKKLARQNCDILLPTIDILGENNTVYVIYEWRYTISLSSYLKDNGGELSWETTKAMFFPFMESLLKLHAEAIFHRGISLDTLWIDENGKLLLSGFAMPCTRTLKSEIDAQLFDGYSAPEQYSVRSWQGTWTDVYSVAAVMYRVLSGTRPVPALERARHDTMLPADYLNPNVEPSVSDALSKAMILRAEQRLQSLDVLMLYLNGTPAKNTRPAKVRESTGAKKTVPKKNVKSNTTKRKKKRRIPYALISAILTILLLSGFEYWLLKGLFPEELTRFINKQRAAMQASASYSEFLPEYQEDSAII